MTELSFSSEPHLSTADFRPQLREALAQAIAEKAYDKLGNGNLATLYKETSDSYVIHQDFRAQAFEVYTTDPKEYLNLLVQAWEIIHPGQEVLTPEDFTLLEKASAHELAHGEATHRWGNSQTTNYYGIAYLLKENGAPLFQPLHHNSGPLKKVHYAAVCAAPEQPSSIDLALIEDLGYGIDLGELRSRAEAEPPMAEDWVFDYRPEFVGVALKWLASAELGHQVG